MPNPTPAIKINPTRVFIFLLICTAIIVGLGIWGQYIRFYPGSLDMHGPWDEFWVDMLMHSFNMDAEANVPTYFNTILLFLPSLIMAAIASWKYIEKDRFRFHWAGLSLLFLYLSVDEASVIHEKLIKPMRAIFDQPGGIFYFAWVIPGLLFIILLGLAYFRFFLDLAPRFKILFFSSVGLYFLGELGGEMMSGWFASKLGQKNFTYSAASNLEECIGLVGLSLLIFSLLKYIEYYLPEGMTIKT